jgi:hypothetical protein
MPGQYYKAQQALKKKKKINMNRRKKNLETSKR